MKRRIAKKLEKQSPIAHRNLSKLLYLYFKIQDYWSVNTQHKCYVCTEDGRMLIYSYIKNGREYKGKGYFMWNDCMEDYRPGVEQSFFNT